MFISLIRNRRLIVELSFVALKRRYAGTLLGPMWAILPPVMLIAAYWFVFEVGLRSQGSAGIPFFFYFTVGMLPWFLFFDTFSSSVNTVVENRHLITKMVFPSEILPVINFMLASVPHMFLLLCMAVALTVQGYIVFAHLYWIVYFYLCTFLLAMGLSWLISSMCVFLRDAAPAAALVVGLVFWITPIMWRIDAIPEAWRAFFEWNPVAYLVNGYRLALMGTGDMNSSSHIRFWIVTLLLLLVGMSVFKRLKHHFADVL